MISYLLVVLMLFPHQIETGGLQVRSNPGKAYVFLDGTVIGRTPLSLSRIRAGTHKLVIYRGGYHPYEADIEIAAGQMLNIDQQLNKATAWKEPPGTDRAAWERYEFRKSLSRGLLWSGLALVVVGGVAMATASDESDPSDFYWNEGADQAIGGLLVAGSGGVLLFGSLMFRSSPPDAYYSGASISGTRAPDLDIELPDREESRIRVSIFTLRW
jgi:hypothetical protein